MSLQALTAYLSIQKPGHTIDSAYALEQKYRLAAATVISQLQSHGYTHTTLPIITRPENTPVGSTSSRKVWLKQETQLDRIERHLQDVNRHLATLGRLLPAGLAEQFEPYALRSNHVQS